LYEDQTPKHEYVVNDYECKIEYFLSDRIYLTWAKFVKTIPFPQGLK